MKSLCRLPLPSGLFIASLTIFALTYVSTEAMAQGRAKIQIEPGVRLGLGDWGDISGPGFGGTLGLHYAVTPELTLLARGGYFFGLRKTHEDNFFFNLTLHSKTNELPLLVGARYHLPHNGAPGPLWAGLEVGMTQLHYFIWFEDDDGDRAYFDEEEFREIEPTLVLGMGYSQGQIEPHLALHWVPLDNQDDFIALVFTLGIDLASF